MPRAIADSDDEEDDLNVALGDQNDHSKPALPQGSQHTDGEVTLNELDGTNEQSTGSTGTFILVYKLVLHGLIACRAPKKANPKCRTRIDDQLCTSGRSRTTFIWLAFDAGKQA